MASTDALPVPRKGASYRLYVAIFDTSGKLVTGGLSGKSCQISKDGAGFAPPAGGDSFTEIGTSGCGYVELNATDMTADHVKVRFTVTNTDALDSVHDLYCEEAGDIRVNLTQINSDSSLIAKLAAAVSLNRIGTVTGSPTTTSITSSDVTDAQADLHNGKLMYFLTGALAGKATRVTDYAAGVFTVEATPIPAVSGNTFILL
jgi:hypothetical protein